LTWAGYYNDGGYLVAGTTAAMPDGDEIQTRLDGGTGEILDFKEVSRASRAAQARAEAKADAEKAARAPHSEEARKAKEAAKGEGKPGPSALSSLSVAVNADDQAAVRAARVSLVDAMEAAHRKFPGSKTASAYLSHDSQGRVFYGVVVKDAKGEMTLVYVDPLSGKVLGTEMGG
jgi:uncharacterized membrane protein YkoI